MKIYIDVASGWFSLWFSVHFVVFADLLWDYSIFCKYMEGKTRGSI